MDTSLGYRLLADLVLTLHVGVVLFVVGGLVAIVVGNLLRRWQWVNARAFRIAHLLAIGIVALQAWLGVVCPLTTWEMKLRAAANADVYAGSFVAHWLQRLLYWDAPPWLFTLAYTLFALAVAAAWWTFPPGRRRPEPPGARGV
jgi:hypothetical protein